MWVRSSQPPKSWINLAGILILYCVEVQTSRAFYKHLGNSHFYHDLWLRCLVSHAFLFLDLLLVLYLWQKSSCHAAGGQFLLLAPPGPNEHTHTSVAWSAGPWLKERGLRGGAIAWHRTLQTTQANGRKAPPIHLHLFFFGSCSCPTPELAHLPRQWYSDTYHLSGFLPFRLTCDATSSSPKLQQLWLLVLMMLMKKTHVNWANTKCRHSLSTLSAFIAVKTIIITIFTMRKLR